MGFKEFHNERASERASECVVVVVVCIRILGLYQFMLASHPLPSPTNARGLPKQLICQPPICPFRMTVAFVSHFIQTTACFRIVYSARANIRREIIHPRSPTLAILRDLRKTSIFFSGFDDGFTTTPICLARLRV